MNVFFDYQIFYFQSYGGISKYFFELTMELKKLKDCQPEILAPYNASAYLHLPEASDLIYKMNPILKRMLNNRFIDKKVSVNESLVNKMCNSENSILHETYYLNRYQVKSKKVITIHDMIYELFDSDLLDRQATIDGKKQSMLEADAIISVSENTKNDIIKFYPEVKDKIHVVHHGVSQMDVNNIKGYTHPKPYILFVGDRGWYKNFNLLLDVYASQKNISYEFDLICFGGEAPSKEELDIISKQNLSGHVHFIKGKDDVLNSLYKSARAFVYISKYEGFGMPLLEAMSMACPVLCSNTSSLPEVAGDAAKIIDPLKSNELIEGLNEVLYNDQSRNELIKKGISRAKQYTWTKCAQETYAIYKKVLEKP